MKSSVHIDNIKDILSFGIGLTQGIDDILLSAESRCQLVFHYQKESLNYNGSNSFLFVNATKI